MLKPMFRDSALAIAACVAMWAEESVMVGGEVVSGMMRAR